jgi:hypothetical protein
MLDEMLTRVAQEFAYERGQNFKGSKFGNFVRRDIATEAKNILSFLPNEMTCKASVGNGKWAAIPWLAFFDPLITTSATRGYYVVYLINPQTQTIYLSLNQGTTAIDREFGIKKGREILKRRALDIRERISDFSSKFDTDPIELGSEADLPTGYQAGHAFGRKYESGSIDSSQFSMDLNTMLAAYGALVDRGGTTPTEAMLEETNSTDIEETRKYILSRRIERSPRVRKQVLAAKDCICEGCGLNPKIDYRYTGKLDASPLDVHHAKPISGLAEGETRRYRIPHDFLILCPNCHRMIHKQKDPADLKLLKRQIGFRYARDVGFDEL